MVVGSLHLFIYICVFPAIPCSASGVRERFSAGCTSGVVPSLLLAFAAHFVDSQILLSTLCYFSSTCLVFLPIICAFWNCGVREFKHDTYSSVCKLFCFSFLYIHSFM